MGISSIVNAHHVFFGSIRIFCLQFLVVAHNREPQSRSQNTTVLVVRIPEKVFLVLGTPHVENHNRPKRCHSKVYLQDFSYHLYTLILSVCIGDKVFIHGTAFMAPGPTTLSPTPTHPELLRHQPWNRNPKS